MGQPKMNLVQWGEMEDEEFGVEYRPAQDGRCIVLHDGPRARNPIFTRMTPEAAIKLSAALLGAIALSPFVIKEDG